VGSWNYFTARHIQRVTHHQQYPLREATIYEFFKNKQDLFYTIPETGMRRLLDSRFTNLENLGDPLHELYVIIRGQMRSVRDAPTYYDVLIRELRFDMGFYTSGGYQLIRKYSSRLVSSIKRGIGLGLFRKDIDISAFRNLYFGTLDELTRSLLMKGASHQIVEHAEMFFNLIWHAIKEYNRETDLCLIPQYLQVP
jgi:TetR/AcrR family fatty acid metabolism transcriptional regulator